PASRGCHNPRRSLLSFPRDRTFTCVSPVSRSLSERPTARRVLGGESLAWEDPEDDRDNKSLEGQRIGIPGRRFERFPIFRHALRNTSTSADDPVLRPPARSCLETMMKRISPLTLFLVGALLIFTPMVIQGIGSAHDKERVADFYRHNPNNAML